MLGTDSLHALIGHLFLQIKRLSSPNINISLTSLLPSNTVSKHTGFDTFTPSRCFEDIMRAYSPKEINFSNNLEGKPIASCNTTFPDVRMPLDLLDP